GRQEVGRGAARGPPRPRGPLLPRALRLLLAALLPAGQRLPEHVGAHHTHGRDHEQPEDRQEGEPDQGEGEGVHRVMCPRVAVTAGCWAAGSWSSDRWCLSCGPCWRSVNTVPAEYQGRAAKRDARAVGE